MLEPLDLSGVVARITAAADRSIIREAVLSTTREVAAEFGKVVPAAYVLRAQGVASTSEHDLALVQNVTASVEIAFVTRRANDPLGSKAVDALRAMRAELWRVLIGWTPPGAALPFELDRFEDGDPRDSLLWGVDRFRTLFQLRAL